MGYSKNGSTSIFIMLVFLLALSIILSPVVMAREVVVVDAQGVESTIQLPIKGVVVTSAALRDVLLALGVKDLVIGRDGLPSFHELYDGVPVVASTSARPQIEAVLELNPHLVIADGMFSQENREKIESFGVPVIVEQGSDLDRLYTGIHQLAQVFEREERGKELTDFLSHYHELIIERLSHIEEEDKPLVFWEWNEPYKTTTTLGSGHRFIDLGGGVNMAAHLEGRFPIVSSEFVWEENPEVIVKMLNRDATELEMRLAWEEVMERPGLAETSAIQNERVYIITRDLKIGLPMIIGSLYYAKWLHPDLFDDLDPGEVFTELLDTFFGMSHIEAEQYLYP